jgi:beta-ureidopropionase
MTVLRAGLIQMGLKGSTEMSPEQIRDKMLEAHIPLIDAAGQKGVQVLCFQEVFTQPYFCPSQDVKWYRGTEKIPDGYTTQLMREYAKKHGMVLVVPIYEEEMTGVYYNAAAVIDADGKYLGKYRKSHLPQVAGFWEKFFFKPGNLGYPMFQTAHCKLGIYICYDRHFPEGWRALALNGAFEPVHLGNRATRRSGGKRILRRCDQSRRHRGAVEHRQVLRLELLREPARQDHRTGEPGPGRAARRRARYGHGARGP